MICPGASVPDATAVIVNVVPAIDPVVDTVAGALTLILFVPSLASVNVGWKLSCAELHT
jgi:hypothetical protein